MLLHVELQQLNESVLVVKGAVGTQPDLQVLHRAGKGSGEPGRVVEGAAVAGLAAITVPQSVVKKHSVRLKVNTPSFTEVVFPHKSGHKVTGSWV